MRRIPLRPNELVERPSESKIGLRWIVATLAAGLVTSVLARLLCGYYSMAIIGPIFCATGGVAQGLVLWRYATRLMFVPWWEWAVVTILSGGVGWLVGIGLGVSIHRGLVIDNPGIISSGMAHHIVFFMWGTATGLLVGLAQGFIFARGLRFVPGSHFNGSTWKAGAVWIVASGASWGVGLLLSELMLLATRRVSVPATPEDGAITPTGLALQIISMVVLGIPISITTGVILARLLRHAGMQVPPRYILIPSK
ncbi:MAG TPA: hypothetical protein VGE04_19770 [Chloroflexia bacterium]